MRVALGRVFEHLIRVVVLWICVELCIGLLSPPALSHMMHSSHDPNYICTIMHKDAFQGNAWGRYSPPKIV